MGKKVYRIAVLGAAGSGKTALIKRFINDEFSYDYDPTIEDAYKKTIPYDGEPAHLQILDTAGKELIANMLDRYLASADAFMVVYSIGSRKSLEYALHLFDLIAQHRHPNSVARMMVAAKCDIDHREISPEEGNDVAAQLQCSFAETSAMRNMNVLEVFEELVCQLRFSESLARRLQQRYVQQKPRRPRDPSDFCCFL